MPDKWEYPWFAAWDLAFHMTTFAMIDPYFAKDQLYLFTREWYMHPNGQIPAYEWNFGDVNPPVHAWATWRVYKIEEEMYGQADTNFLEDLFQKLCLYFTWWVNRKDSQGKNIFEGGFLGLDNIGAIDRSKVNELGGTIEQSDGTSWMAMYCLNMLKISTELVKKEQELADHYDKLRDKYGQAALEQGDLDLIETYRTLVRQSGRVNYEDMASKFFQHFLLIADAMNKIGEDSGVNIWNDKDKFYYDILNLNNGAQQISMELRSMVGLIPLFAVESLEPDLVDKYLASDFQDRMNWFVNNRPNLLKHKNIQIRLPENPEKGVKPEEKKEEKTEEKRALYLSLVNKERLQDILNKMLNENEFLSAYGIRALSKHYEGNNRYTLPIPYPPEPVEYEPAESKYPMFGGNSNWRGPIWMPVNFLIIESLQKFYDYWGEDIKVNCKGADGKIQEMNLQQVSIELSRRLLSIFLKQPAPNSSPSDQSPKYWRPVYGGSEKFQDEDWCKWILFYEYFHGDNGAGIGASHQTGWTGLVANLIQQSGEKLTQQSAEEEAKKK